MTIRTKPPFRRWTLAVAATASVALGWPSEPALGADAALRPQSHLAALSLAGVWKTPSADYVVTLYLQPRGAEGFDLTSVVDNWWMQSVTTYHARARLVALGGSASALWIGSGAPPFRTGGYFIAGAFRSGPGGAPIVRGRDVLIVCPIAQAMLIDAIRRGQIDGRIATRTGHQQALLADSSPTLGVFLSTHRKQWVCAQHGFVGVRVGRSCWSPAPAVPMHRPGGAT